MLGPLKLLSELFFSVAFPFQWDHHLILLLVVQLYTNFVLKLLGGKEDRYLNLSKYQIAAVGNSFKDFLLLNVALNC